MNLGFQYIAQNLNMTIENIVIFVVLFGSVIFAAKDFKIWLITSFLSFGGLFMWFYKMGFNYTTVLTLMFLYLVMMVFTIYSMAQATRKGTII